MSLRLAKSVSAPRNRNALEGDQWRSVGELKQLSQPPFRELAIAGRASADRPRGEDDRRCAA